MNKKILATMIMAAGLLATACGDDEDDNNDIDTPIVTDGGSVTTMGTDTTMSVDTTVAP